MDAAAATKAIDDAALDWLRQHFKDLMSNVIADGGKIEGAFVRFDIGIDKLLEVHAAAKNAVVAKLRPA